MSHRARALMATTILGTILITGALGATAETPPAAAPPDASALFGQGQALASAERLAEAVVPLTAAAALAPEDVRILTLLAKVKGRMGAAKEAAELFRRVVVLQPHSATAHLDLAIALADAADTKTAMEEVAESIKLDPRNARAHLNRARLMADAGRIAESRTEFQRAAQLSPQDPEVDYFWGVMEKTNHQPKSAATLFAKVVERQPDNGRAYILLAQSLESLGQKERAIAAWRHAVAIDPSSQEATYALAQALRETDPSASAKMLERFDRLKVEKEVVDKARDLGNEAYAAMQQQSWWAAITSLQQAIDICHDCALAADLHQRLGLAECHAGNLDVGERELRIALSLNPNDGQTVEALQWVAKQRKKAAPNN